MTSDPLLAVAELVDRLERAWYQAEAWDDSGTHPYTPYPLPAFLTGLQAALAATTGRRYLEVGCGIGSKLVVATFLGFDVHAIESRAQHVATARYLCPEAAIQLADARAFDGYGDFDVIYCYRPIIDKAAEAIFEDALAAAMRSGSVLFLADHPFPRDGWQPVATDVWLKY